MELNKEEQMVIDLMRTGAHIDIGLYDNKRKKRVAKEICERNGIVEQKELDNSRWYRSANKNGKININAFYYGSMPYERKTKENEK